jgi:restriction system protein
VPGPGTTRPGSAWHEQCQTIYTAYLAEQQKRQHAEAERVEKLMQAEAVYQEQCRQREAEAEARTQELDKLINDLAFDVPDAIEEYVGIVLSNSVYPDVFPMAHDHRFDLASRELILNVSIPEHTKVPAVKAYRYVKAKDEITTTALPVKVQKDLYANAVWQAAVRSLHEVFEADRAGKIRSIALTVGVERTAPATGRPETVPLVAVAADRQTFGEFDLANVVPQATLAHLGAAMSKSPFDLTPADTSLGVRVWGQA